MLTLYTTPVVYLYLDRFRLYCKRVFARRMRPVDMAGDTA
jgi:multidrug efflux pump